MAYYYQTVNGGDSTASTKKKKTVEDFTGRYPGDTYNGGGFTDLGEYEINNDKGDNTPPGGTGGYNSFSFNPYKESQAVIDARNAMNAHNANPIADWTGGQYGAALQNAINKIVNREKFSYDMNADALYQQYKDRYIGLGKMAMQDTMGQAQGQTGGYGNSYAATAGNQAYQGYLQGLNDKVPELYELAYNKYNQEGQDLLNQYNMYNNAYQTEYGQYRDKVNDWYTEANRLSNDYYNAYNQDYSLYSDNYARAFQNHSLAQNLALDWAKLNASNSNSSAKAIEPYNQKITELQGQLDNSFTLDQLNKTKDEITTFNNGLMNNRAFVDAKRNGWGKNYGNYEDYYADMFDRLMGDLKNRGYDDKTIEYIGNQLMEEYESKNKK